MAQRDALIQAAAADDVATLRRLLGEDTRQLHSKDLRGDTPMMAAARANSVDALHVLIDKAAGLRPYPNGGRQALEAAAEAGHPEAVQVLCRAGEVGMLPREWARSEVAFNAMDAACRLGHVGVAHVLLQHDLDSAVVGCGLYSASTEGHVAVVMMLLRHQGGWGVLCDESSGFGEALRKGHVEVVLELLVAGSWGDMRWNNAVRSKLRKRGRDCPVPEAITMVEVSRVSTRCSIRPLCPSAFRRR